MSALRGWVADEFGQPTRSVLLDEGPSRARLTAGRGTLNGNLVVGRSGAKVASEAAKAAMRDRWANREAT
jgi:hypothetical protein